MYFKRDLRKYTLIGAAIAVAGPIMLTLAFLLLSKWLLVVGCVWTSVVAIDTIRLQRVASMAFIEMFGLEED